MNLWTVSVPVTRTAPSLGSGASPTRFTQRSESVREVVRLVSTKWSESGPTVCSEAVRMRGSIFRGFFWTRVGLRKDHAVIERSAVPRLVMP
jgi:hypothetical protein